MMMHGVVVQFLLHFLHGQPELLAFVQSSIEVGTSNGRGHRFNGEHVLANEFPELIEQKVLFIAQSFNHNASRRNDKVNIDFAVYVD
jgi:hypothetical protein